MLPWVSWYNIQYYGFENIPSCDLLSSTGGTKPTVEDEHHHAVPEMGGLGAETLGTETFVVSVPVSVPPRLKMSGLVKVSVSRDFILKSLSRSRFHETQNESLGLGLGSMRPKLKVLVSVSFLRPGKLLVLPITAF